MMRTSVKNTWISDAVKVHQAPRLTMAVALAVLAFCSWWVILKALQYGVNVPFWDQWDYIAQLHSWDRGEKSWLDVLTHTAGEHLIGGQVLLSAIEWHITGMNLRGLMVWNWFVALSFCLLAAWMTARELGYKSPIPWVVLGASAFFIYNPAAYQLWLWALPQIYLLVYLFLVVGVLLIQSRFDSGIKLSLIGVLAFGGTFLLGNGAVLWLILPVVLIAHCTWRELKARRIGVGIYLVLLGAAAVCYLVLVGSYKSPAPPAAGSSAGAIVSFFLTYTGNLVSLAMPNAALRVAQLVGLLLTGLFCVSVFLSLRLAGTRERRRTVLVWALIGGLSLLSGMLAAIARHSFGPMYPLEASRYVLASAFLPLAAVVLSAMALEDFTVHARAELRAYSLLLFLLSGLVFIALIARIQQTSRAEELMAHTRFSELSGKVASLASSHFELANYRQIYPHNNYRIFQSSVEYLDRQGWLRPRAWDESFLRSLPMGEPTPGAGNVDKIAVGPRSVEISGWAYLPHRQERAHAVIITASQDSNSRIVGTAFTSQPRPDVQASIKHPEAYATGWTASIPRDRVLTVGSHVTIRCYAYDAESGAVHFLTRAQEIILPDSEVAPPAKAKAAAAGR
jgi:hypothetical protein